MISVANPSRSVPDTTTRMRRLPLLLGLLTACPRPAPPPPPVDARQYSFPETTTPWGRHPGADVCFPTTAPVGWRFGGTHHYDNPAGLDLSWSYTNDDGTLLSVFVYPQHGPPPDGLSREKAAALGVAREVPGVEWALTGEIGQLFVGPGFVLGGVQQLPLAQLLPPESHADVAKQLGVASLDGVTRALGTLVLIWPADPWFVKLRATWLDSERSAAEVVPELIGWSAVPCFALVTAEGQVPIADVPPEGLPRQAP